MKKALIVLVVLAMAGSAWAAGIVPDGATGLWRFQNSTDKLKATFGADLVSSVNNGWMTGPWTMIGVPGNAGYFADGGVIQELQYGYLTVNPNFTANGGGSYVNQYTVAIDYVQTSEVGLWEGNYYNSLFQTAGSAGSNDGDLFIKGPTRSASVIGNGDTGYSTLTFDSSAWHRIVWSVDNSSFFRVYVDGTLFLDAPGQGVDGRFSLDTNNFYLFADNDGEDAWGLVGTAATWGRALSTAEVAQMGGWIGGSATPTELMIVPEPGIATMLFLGVFGLLAARTRRG